MHPPISPTEARRRIHAHLPALAAIACPLHKCAGRVLREPINADRPLPPFNRSMMDGYALRAAELSTVESFTVTVQAPAGSPAQSIGPQRGACAEIMTGAVVPHDADCVLPYEATTTDAQGRIRARQPAAHRRGDCIHALGSDFQGGDVLVPAGTILGSHAIAVAATCGYSNLQVAKIPAIAIVSTGDELVDVDAKPLAHQIRRSNDLAIDTALARLQLHAQQRRHLPDDRQRCSTELAELIGESDFVIISGGISKGKKDYIPEILSALGLQCQFHGVRQKPGKPFGYWSHPHGAVFTLPGNPLSALTALHHYALPAIERAMGRAAAPQPQQVELAEAAKARDDITLFLPVQLIGANRAQPRPAQNSGDQVSVLNTDGYLELPPSTQRVYPAGTTFDFYPWL